MNNKLIIIFLLTIFVLAACGGSSPASPADVEPATPAPAESQPTATSAPVEEVPAATEETAATEEAASPTVDAGTASVSFEADVRPIIDAKCIRCHGIETTREGLDMLNYTNLMKGSRNGPVIVPGNAKESLLVQLVEQGEMPSRGQKVTPEELQLIIEWVNQGALNN